jgi:hypothetical protein
MGLHSPQTMAYIARMLLSSLSSRFMYDFMDVSHIIFLDISFAYSSFVMVLGAAISTVSSFLQMEATSCGYFFVYSNGLEELLFTHAFTMTLKNVTFHAIGVAEKNWYRGCCSASAASS